MQLEIRERAVGDVIILEMFGKITIGEGSVQLRDAVSNLLDSGRNKIVLNLGGVNYVDSSGIGELVSRYTTTKNTGGRLKLLNLPKKIEDRGLKIEDRGAAPKAILGLQSSIFVSS